MFPTEFADLLNRRGRKLLDGDGRGHEVFRRRGATPIVLYENLIDDDTARRCIADLDRGMYPYLKRMYTPIPREAIAKMKENYSDRLRKTVRVRTATFNSPKSRVLDAANAIGLGPMLASQTFLRFAEVVVGQPMRSDWWGRQVICYEPGDYSGPHNDHHPEHDEIKNGFVDVHIMFSNDAVASQLLVYEEKGFLSRSHEVAGPSGIAVYRLPFWHYTTPLVARKGREGEARRWLLLGSFHFATPPKRLMYR
ncbi:MAG TPA: hypothetical protein VI670_24715 [Thermoanaerobaculia bacterium]|jgi:hypothetical protein